MGRDWQHFGEGPLKEQVCPICGGGKGWCEQGPNGLVWCGRSDGSKVPGFDYLKPGTTGHTYRETGADRGDYVPLDQEAIRRRAEAREADLKKRIDRARYMWGSAKKTEDNGPAIAYFRARGLSLDDLPPSIRFLPDCPFYPVDEKAEETLPKEPGLAVVAGLQDVNKHCVAVQLIYLDPANPGRKRPGEGKNGPKKTHGAPAGGAVRIGGLHRDATLVICEGVETALAIHQATHHAVWACLGTSGLLNVDLVPGHVTPSVGLVRRVIIAGDYDEHKPEPLNHRPGSHYAAKAAERLRREYPHLEVMVSIPSNELVPDLIDAEGEIVGGGKSIDWLDVLVKAGADTVRKGIARGYLAPLPPSVKVTGLQDPVLTRSNLERARRVLEALFAPEVREYGRWHLVWWRENWYVRDPSNIRWKLEHEKIIHARVWTWLDKQLTYTKVGAKEPLNPTGRAVEDIMRALVAEVAVSSDSMPCWLPPTFDGEGNPIWGAAVDPRTPKGEAPIPLESIIAAPNCLFDADAWIRGEQHAHQHTPLWFSDSCLSYEIPLGDLPPADATAEDLDALYGKVCPHWMGFLEEVLEDQVKSRALQQYFGYCQTYDIRYQKGLLLPGPPRSGKSTTLLVLTKVTGEDAVAATSLNRIGGKFDLAVLVGKKLATMGDAHMGKQTDPVLANEVIKSVLGGDRQPVEEKYEKRQPAVRIACKVAMVANELPKLPDSSGAGATRFIVVPFSRSYLGEEDTGLLPRLEAEAAGVFVWAMVGLRDLRKAGKFVQPKDGLDLLEEWKSMNSPVHAWVQDECIVQEGSSVETMAAFNLYSKWAKEHGHGEMAAARFGMQLRAAVPSIRKLPRAEGKKRWRVYAGIRPWLSTEDRGQPAKPLNVATVAEVTGDADDSPTF